MTMSNAAFSTEPKFVAACEKAKEVFGITVKPTAAQASKYRRGYGVAYNAERGQALGSRIDAHDRPETLEASRSTGKPSKINDYGPYSATPRNNKPAPHPVAKKN